MSAVPEARRFIWHELLTPDPDGARGFYETVVGWSSRSSDSGSTPYWTWVKGEALLGGLMELPEDAHRAGMPPHWLGYVYSPDVEADADRVEALGGRVPMRREDVPSVGRIGVVQDPQGAVLSLFTPENPAMPGASGSASFSWHELATTDLDGATAFYRELFGWGEIETHDMGPLGPYRIFGPGDDRLVGMFRKPEEMPGPPAWLHYIRIPDADEAVERIGAGGGSVLVGPREVPGGDRIVQALDPQGATFALHEVNGEPTSELQGEGHPRERPWEE